MKILHLILFVCFLETCYVEFANSCFTSKRYFPGGIKGEAKAIAILKGKQNGQDIDGIIQFDQKGIDGSVRITGNITGLPKNAEKSKHGFHIHQRGITVTDDGVSRCKSSGGHFNPTGAFHGDKSDTLRHVGDLGNVVSENGIINIDIVDDIIKLYGPFGIIGRTVVLHLLEDDLGRIDNTGSKMTGNAGARIACGVIAIL